MIPVHSLRPPRVLLPLLSGVMRFFLLTLLLAGPVAAQTDSPMPDDVPTLNDLESLYSAADEVRARTDFAALTPDAVLADAWSDVTENATVLRWGFRGLTDTTPVPGMTAAEARAERRLGLGSFAPLAAATAATLTVVAPLHLALTPPSGRAAAYDRIGRDADALRLLLSDLAYELADAAVGSDDEVDAALVALVPRAALVDELVSRLQNALPETGAR